MTEDRNQMTDIRGQISEDKSQKTRGEKQCQSRTWLLFSVPRFPFSVFGHLSSVFCHLSSVICLLSSALCHPPALRSL